eukprot:412518_1
MPTKPTKEPTQPATNNNTKPYPSETIKSTMYVPTSSIPIISPSDISNSICLDKDGFINTTYQLSALPTLCDDGVYLIDILSKLIDIIDITYREHNLLVRSNISHEEQKIFENITVCGNVTFNVITCFNSTRTVDILLNVTESTDFIQDINNKIGNNNTIIVYIKNTTIGKIPSDPANDNSNSIITIIIVISVSLIFILLVAVMILIANRKKMYRYKNEMVIENPMVLLLAIGVYDESADNADDELANSMLSNLDVDKDIQNLYTVFGPDNLDYAVFPTYDNIEIPKIHWTQNEMITFLKKKAREFDESDEFDSLIVVISSHGMSNAICTSDYKLIDKVAIHRLFSVNYYNSRLKPRIFMFDCCDGSFQHGGKMGPDTPISPIQQPSAQKMAAFPAMSSNRKKMTDETKQVGKGFHVEDITEEKGAIWAHNSKNPDFRLVQINAANPGFQSRLNIQVGSYMLYSFMQKQLDNLNKNNEKYIHELFDEIQTELEQDGKQHIVAIYNDHTRYIRLKKNNKQKNKQMVQQNEIEMIMYHE